MSDIIKKEIPFGVVIYVPRIKFMSETYFTHDSYKGLTFGKIYNAFISSECNGLFVLYLYNDDMKKHYFLSNNRKFKYFKFPKKFSKKFTELSN